MIAKHTNENPTKQCDNELSKVCKKILELDHAINRAECPKRYEIAELVCDAKNTPGKYGKNAVEKIANELSWGRSTAYAYAKIAETWSKDEYFALVKQATDSGFSLSWTHFLEVVDIEDPEVRSELLETAIARKQSTRQLRHAVQKAKEPGKDLNPNQPASEMGPR